MATVFPSEKNSSPMYSTPTHQNDSNEVQQSRRANGTCRVPTMMELISGPSPTSAVASSFPSTPTKGHKKDQEKDGVQSPTSTLGGLFQTRTRFALLGLCLLCLASIWSNILCFNFALVCIDGQLNGGGGGHHEGGEETGPTAALLQRHFDSMNAGHGDSDSSHGHHLKTGNPPEAEIVDETSLGGLHHHNHQSNDFSPHQNLKGEGNGSSTVKRRKRQSLHQNLGIPPLEHLEGHEEAGEESTASSTSKTYFPSGQRLCFTSAVAAAALVANFLVVPIVDNYGIRTPMAVLGLTSAIATLLLPLAIESREFYAILVFRMLQGVAFSVSYPVIGGFTSRWTYYKQTGLFVATLVAYTQLAPAITMPLSGELCSSHMGWRSVFYVHGIASGVLVIFFFAIFRNNPGKHPLVGEVELGKIIALKAPGQLSSGRKHRESEGSIILKVLRTPSVWAILIAGLGNFFVVNLLFLYSPRYLKTVLHFPVNHAGFSASLAPISQFCIKLCAGFTSDKVKSASETNKLRIFNSIAFFGTSVSLTALALLPTEQPFLCVGALGASAGFLGFATGGFFKAAPLVARQHSSVVMGQIAIAKMFTLLIVPMVVIEIAPDNNPANWSKMFLLSAGLLFVCNAVFCLMVSGEPAPWTIEEMMTDGAVEGINGRADGIARNGTPSSTLDSSTFASTADFVETEKSLKGKQTTRNDRVKPSENGVTRIP